LGNIMAGFTAKRWGFHERIAREGFEWAVGGADKWTEWDAAATGVGNYLANGGVPSSSREMCSSMKAIDKCSSSGELYPEACWRNMQAPCAEKCVPCESSISALGHHTNPAFASDPAGYSIFAGAPKYEYYTDQIPLGMLDPLIPLGEHLYEFWGRIKEELRD
jgi:hypothetical protein